MTKGVSVVVAVYHAEDKLNSLLENLKKQKNMVLGDNLELLLIYGDKNENLKPFESIEGIRVVANPDQDPMSAKHIGFNCSNFDYISFIDQDEILLNDKSLTTKVELFEAYRDLMVVFPTGYLNRTEDGYPNIYTSEYGDPYSYFFSKIRNNPQRGRKFYTKLKLIEKSHYFINDSHIRNIDSIVLESSSMSTMVCRSRIRDKFSERNLGRESLPMLGYMVSNLGNANTLALLKEDFVEHHSSTSWKIIFKKIKWRIDSTLSGPQVENSVSAGLVARKLLSEQVSSVDSKVLSKVYFVLKNSWYLLSLVLFIPVAWRTLKIIHQQKKMKCDPLP